MRKYVFYYIEISLLLLQFMLHFNSHLLQFIPRCYFGIFSIHLIKIFCRTQLTNYFYYCYKYLFYMEYLFLVCSLVSTFVFLHNHCICMASVITRRTVVGSQPLVSRFRSFPAHGLCSVVILVSVRCEETGGSHSCRPLITAVL